MQDETYGIVGPRAHIFSFTNLTMRANRHPIACDQFDFDVGARAQLHLPGGLSSEESQHRSSVMTRMAAYTGVARVFPAAKNYTLRDKPEPAGE